MNDGLSLPDNRRSPVPCSHGQPMMHATSRHVSGRSSPDLSTESSRSDSSRGQHDVRMGICFIHVMERHISNHALTDKVFSDKGENGFRAASCGSSRGMASSISRAIVSSSGVRPSQRHSRVRHGSYTRQGLSRSQNHSFSHTAFAGVGESVRYAHQASVNRNDRQQKQRRCSRCFWR